MSLAMMLSTLVAVGVNRLIRRSRDKEVASAHGEPEEKHLDGQLPALTLPALVDLQMRFFGRALAPGDEGLFLIKATYSVT